MGLGVVQPPKCKRFIYLFSKGALVFARLHLLRNDQRQTIYEIDAKIAQRIQRYRGGNVTLSVMKLTVWKS